jgi:hypothetical protein
LPSKRADGGARKTAQSYVVLPIFLCTLDAIRAPLSLSRESRLLLHSLVVSSLTIRTAAIYLFACVAARPAMPRAPAARLKAPTLRWPPVCPRWWRRGRGRPWLFAALVLVDVSEGPVHASCSCASMPCLAAHTAAHACVSMRCGQTFWNSVSVNLE